MHLHLTSADLNRCEAVSRALLSPLASGTVDEWRSEVLSRLRDLLHTDQSLFMLSTADKVHYSDSLDARVVRGYDQFLAGTDSSGVRLTDPVVARWLRERQAIGQSVFTNLEVNKLLAPYGLSLSNSPMFQEGMAAAGVVDQRSMFVTFPGGASMIQCGLTGKGSAPFGDGVIALLGMLLPSYQAGLRANAIFTQRWASLDAMAEAVAVFGEAKRELHRNPALSQMMESEPQRHLLQGGILRIAASLYPLAIEAKNHRVEEVLPESRHAVVTESATYHMRATLLPSGAFADHPAVMVWVECRGSSPLPAPEVLRERYPLTKREAEVALLMAEGHSNAQIAENLFLSIHTVRRHVEGVFAKVGINSRKALGLHFMEGRSADQS
jgi:DNA-binding CsgD family transcriptional regulator